MNEGDYLEPMRETLLRVDEQMDRRGWDQPSALGIVIRRDVGNTSVIGVLEFPGWPVVIDAASSAQEAIDVLCQACEALGSDSPRPANFYGICYAAEAWTLKAPKDLKGLTPEQWRDSHGAIKDHPDRIESRIVVLAPVIGEPMMLQRDRGGPARISQSSDKGYIGGGIPKRLVRLAEALAV